MRAKFRFFSAVNMSILKEWGEILGVSWNARHKIVKNHNFILFHFQFYKKGQRSTNRIIVTQCPPSFAILRDVSFKGQVYRGENVTLEISYLYHSTRYERNGILDIGHLVRLAFD